MNNDHARKDTPDKTTENNNISKPSILKKKVTFLVIGAIVLLIAGSATIIIALRTPSKEQDLQEKYSLYRNTPDEDEPPQKSRGKKTQTGNSTNTVLPAKTSGVMGAVTSGDYRTLSELLNRGVSPNAQNESTSPLHQAVIRNSIEATTMLLDKGANPSFQDSNGDTPLHYALKDESLELTRLLLSRGSNPNITDHNGETPLQIADDLDREDLYQLLKQYGAN